METEIQMQLRHAMEHARGAMRMYTRRFREAYILFTAAVICLLGSLTLGPYGVIPEGMAWGVGIIGTIVFGACSIAQFDWLYHSDTPNFTTRKHELERAEKRYYDALSK